MRNYICFDIGGTSIKFGVIDEDGKILFKDEMDSEARVHGGPGIVRKIVEKANFYKDEYSLEGIAVSSHGMIDSKEGKILFADTHLIPDYSGLEFKKMVEDGTSLPCEIENDVNCAGLGELWLGDDTDAELVSMIAIGTGIGACLIENGRLITGNSKCAGEIGKITIPGGRFEDVASSYAMTSSLERKLGKEPGSINGKMVFEEISKGNQVAIDAVDEMIKNLAIGISSLCFIFNPGVVILGGGIMAQEDYFRPRLLDELKKLLPAVIFDKTELRFAKLKNNAGMIGALRNFRNIHG